MIDNAHKWSPPDTPLLVTVSGSKLTVTDHGPGISEGDKPLVFERFYRSTEAKGTPGSRLGSPSSSTWLTYITAGRSLKTPRGGGAVVGFELP